MAVQQQPSSDAIVTDGNARFQVLTPTLVRLEYSSSGEFEDRPTFFVVDRDLTPPEYDTRISDGWIEIDTGSLRLRYKRGSGPFTEVNTELELSDGEFSTTSSPSWNRRVYRSEDAALDGSARLCADRDGYTSTCYVGGFGGNGGDDVDGDRGEDGERRGDGSEGEDEAVASWDVEPLPAEGEYTLAVRYANAADADGSLTARVDGEDVGRFEFSETDGWSVGRIDVPMGEEASTLALAGTDDDAGDVHVDYLMVSGIGESPIGFDSTNLGGWYRDLDGQGDSVELFDGLLDRDGWYLLDDSGTAVLTDDDWVEPRDRDDAYQDGYLFGYGRDYEQGLRDLRRVTGPAPLLPKWAFGNWYSRYYPYSADEYREELLPKFREERVPLDVLVVDTDWKAPKIPGVKGAGASWSGWNWDTDLIPDPEAFMDWTDEQGLHVSMNVHPSIYHRDPKFERADELAGGLPEGRCVGPDTVTCGVWNWADPDHVESYFFLHDELDEAGQDLWWFDWLADSSGVDMAGLTSDSWINALYADRRRDRGGRGFAFSRIGASWRTDGLNSPGPWAEHRYTLHFTGDTRPTWEMLDFQTYFTVREGNVGLPYVSHDIGSHTGGGLSTELYVRWLQSGTFQPILRLHSVPGGQRLPWEYQGDAREIAGKFLRLRHALVPYLYTVAREAHDTGLPMTRGMYLEYPDADAAYSHDRQYLLGDDVLVAPVGEPAEQADEDDGTATLGTRCMAERATLDGGAYSNAFYSGFSGSSYVEGYTEEGARITWTIESDGESSEYDLLVRYANHVAEAGEEPGPESLTLFVDGERVEQLTLDATESWHEWTTHRTTVELSDGGTDVRLERTADDDGNVNVDCIALVEPGDPLPEEEPPEPVQPARKDVWFPPGEWTDFFTGETYEGPRVETVEVPIERIPVFVRSGGVVPLQPYMDYVDAEPVDPLTLRVYSGADGEFDLYEDAGEGPEYRDGECAWTRIKYEDDPGTASGSLTVGAADGNYPGQPTDRGYRVEFVNADRPDRVEVDGHRLDETAAESDATGRDSDGECWWYDEDDQTLVVALDARPTDEPVTVVHG
jgi:hypothetical protein